MIRPVPSMPNPLDLVTTPLQREFVISMLIHSASGTAGSRDRAHPARQAAEPAGAQADRNGRFDDDLLLLGEADLRCTLIELALSSRSVTS